MGVRFMLDSDNLSDLDPVAELLATYSDLVPDAKAFRQKFPDNTVILIDRGLGDPSGEATVFDIERGALTIPQAVAEYDRKHAAGVDYLTGYVDRANLDAFNQAFGDRHVYRWIATLDGTSHIQGLRALHAPAAIQCLPESDLGIHADGSLVFEDYWNPSRTATTIRGVRADVTSIGGAAEKIAHRLATLANQLKG